MRLHVPGPNAALLVATLALLVAFAGSALAVYAARSGDSLIAKRFLSGGRLRLNTVTGAEIADLVWYPFALLNGWANYNGSQRTPAWALDAEAIVHFRGAIDQPTANASMTFASPPLVARPQVDVWLTTNALQGVLRRGDQPAAREDLDPPSGQTICFQTVPPVQNHSPCLLSRNRSRPVRSQGGSWPMRAPVATAPYHPELATPTTVSPAHDTDARGVRTVGTVRARSRSPGPSQGLRPSDPDG